jgi:putative DNA primase/helicase
MNNFLQATNARGLVIEHVNADGKLHRVPVEGKPKTDKTGWYVYHAGGDRAYAVFGRWDDGLPDDKWCERGNVAWSPEEKTRIKQALRDNQAEGERRRKEAAADARALFERSPEADNSHAYLQNKRVKAFGLRVSGAALLISLCDAEGVLWSLQRITPNGDKRFFPSGRTAGCFHWVGEPEGASLLLLAEGYATAATIHEATGLPVAAAMNCGNLLPVAEALAAKYPNAHFLVCADDDRKPEGKGNAGIEAARKVVAVLKGRARFVAPVGAEGYGSDFNDLAAVFGLDEVKRQVEAAIKEQADEETVCHGTEVALQCGDTITPEPISWLWQGWLAAGKLHILAGAPGTGKTTIALALAATVSQGGRWPDGTRAAVGNVVIWSGEDDQKDTLAPRLIAVGADMSRIHFVTGACDTNGNRAFDPATDTKALHTAILRKGGASLLIVDPITSAVTGDSHKNAEVRRGLQPMADLAAATGCALLGISHFSKGTAGREPTERVTGSLAFGAFARIVMVTAKRSAEEAAVGGDRVLCRSKSNIGTDTGGFAYDLQQVALDRYHGIEASRVLWGEAIEGTAREILAVAEAVAEDEGGGVLGEAIRFLIDMLSDGAKRQSDVLEFAVAEGFSEKTVRRAKKSLEIVSKKSAYAGGWFWELPSPNMAKMAKNTEDAQQKKVGILGNLGHLGANDNGKTPLAQVINGAEIVEGTI